MKFCYDYTDWLINLNSTLQLREFLYGFLKLEPIKVSKITSNESTDEATITQYAENHGVKFCALLVAYRKLLKAQNTYLADILRNISDEDFKLHPDFWLNTAETYRSSSTDPNFQNIPKHGEIVNGIDWKIIRKMFKALDPIEDWFVAETDYDGAEVKVAGMLGNDPQMIEDLNHDLDMHSHWAIELFGLKGMSYKEVKVKYDDTYRFLAKNNFTFANFFGAVNTSIAQEMRKSPFYEEYVRGFYKQSKFKSNWEKYYIEFSENHIAECQNAFYNRYNVYKTWQDSLVENYYKTGYVENPFGFRRRYPLSRNEIINYPIQSTSFLLLLDSLIRIEEIIENDDNWKSHPIGQVHDSAYNNVYKYEAPDYIDMVDDIMCNKPHLPWTQSVKMKTDWSFGKNWLEMFRVNAYKNIN
jgi:DNA polymerase I-like protein with 3'-5' exonuclease and polymerase domains